MKVKHSTGGIDFEWDSEKAAKNAAKHGITFEEASEVFLDPFVQTVDSPEIGEEAREAVVGLAKSWKMLFVAFIWREAIRLISARKATKPERKKYEDQ